VGLGRKFYANLWQWVTEHSDIRIIHNNEVAHYSLTEFEEAERTDTGTLENVGSEGNSFLTNTARKAQPAESLFELSAALRQRLSTEVPGVNSSERVPQPLPSSNITPAVNAIENATDATHTVALPRKARKLPTSGDIIVAAFDDPTCSTSAPRLFASQNRIWQALTGHGMDFKKVPVMEFALLSIIAANGENGITQPDLAHFSGQDKRSVPHRTDELARKGYIVKNPVQARKIRTSICHHTKFVSQDHFTNSGTVEGVFQVGQFVASGFMDLLYKKFKDAGVVPTREIRTRLVSKRSRARDYI
jgi:transcription factor C subunit 3